MKLTHLLYYKSDTPTSFLPAKRPPGPMFDDPGLNRMIDENYEAVRRCGYAKLTVPVELHGIRKEAVSEHGRYVADVLLSSGFHAYLCGGAVRDLIRGVMVNDFDFVTEASNKDLRRIFGPQLLFHRIPLGHEFGYIDFGDEIVDVGTMVNIPPVYAGLPKVPEFDPEALYSTELMFDGFQRDFSINAIYYDMAQENLIDFFGGIRDLREGLVRMVASEETAVRYDPRRILRALRFRARFGFSFEEGLETAIREFGQELVPRITPEMMADNLPDFFSGGFAGAGSRLLLDYGLFGIVFPAAAKLVSQPSYREYVLKTAHAVDWIFDEGAQALPLLAMAAFLWPAARKRKQEGAEDAAGEIAAQQRKVMAMTDEEAAYLRSALDIEEVHDRERIREEVIRLYEKPAITDALEILRLHYWMQQEQ